jgi:hypothetical protein
VPLTSWVPGQLPGLPTVTLASHPKFYIAVVTGCRFSFQMSPCQDNTVTHATCPARLTGWFGRFRLPIVSTFSCSAPGHGKLLSRTKPTSDGTPGVTATRLTMVVEQTHCILNVLHITCKRLIIHHLIQQLYSEQHTISCHFTMCLVHVSTSTRPSSGRFPT